MSVLSRKQTTDAADRRGRLPQLARPTALARAAVPMAKTAGSAARDGARNVATWTAPRIHGARAWTAPRIERSGLAIRDTIAPKVCETLMATARRVDVTPPRLDITEPRRRWPKIVAGTAVLAAAAAAAAGAAAGAVVLRRQKNDGTRTAAEEGTGTQTGQDGQPGADGAEDAISRQSPVT
jgi:hypothetical protein